jgi:murein L,D-transpeptidase YcbB/YkuD
MPIRRLTSPLNRIRRLTRRSRRPESRRQEFTIVASLLLALFLPALLPIACGKQGPSQAAINHAIQMRVVHDDKSISIAGERLIESHAVARFYKAHKYRASWSRDAVPKVIDAIKGVYADGLNPDDYHLATIQKLDEQREHASTAELEGDLDLLLTDAIAAIFDHVRYGKVRPGTIDPHWNVDPRDDMPPLEEQVGQVVGAKDPAAAILAEKPDHFIYKGLVAALAQMRVIQKNGGWGTVPAGKAIKPGRSDPRIPRVRARLAVSGELDAAAAKDSSARYDPRLVAAVKLFQARHRMDEDGIIDKKAVDAMNVSAAERAAQIRVNLERARWVLGGLKGDFVLVNLPAFKAYLIQNGQNVWEGRTQIGDEGKMTPTFRAQMKTVVFNPDWTVPQSIIVEEILPDIQAGKDGLGSRGLKVYDNNGNEVDPGSVDLETAVVKQPPGPKNALGRVKFLFPNKYSIYLHDTPSQGLFDSEKRTFSHGCIRLEHAMDLARMLLRGQMDSGAIANAVATGETQDVALQRKPYVLIVYWTVSVGAGGEVRYADDIYHQDQALLDRLNAAPAAA